MNALDTLMSFAPFALLATPMAGLAAGICLMFLERRTARPAAQRFAVPSASGAPASGPSGRPAAGLHIESLFGLDAEPANDAAPAHAAPAQRRAA